MTRVEERRAEYFASVWNHSEDEFQATFDERRGLNPSELSILKLLISQFEAGSDDLKISLALRSKISGEKTKILIEVLLQIAGITRNKILQDIKAKAASRRRNLRLSSHLQLSSHEETWNLAGPYLVRKLRKVLHHPGQLDPISRMLEAVNQATWPGYIRQERAKRSGHEAEYRIATLLSRIGIPFAPLEKADNPLCRDAIWNGVSFDIIIPDCDSPLICIKSTVHTSNIGQYGESKDHLEVDEARRMIDLLPRASRPILVGFIDGVGFESNSAGLNGVLEKADEFCQFNTIWKLCVLAASKVGRKCRLFLPPPERRKHQDFLSRYRGTIIELNAPFSDGIEAGLGSVQLI